MLYYGSSNGKKYVGSATGENMIWGRWKDYIANGNGGNIELKSLDFEYIQKNFRYSILEIYKSTTDDDAILERESWWKELLMTRQFGYNKNRNHREWGKLSKLESRKRMYGAN